MTDQSQEQNQTLPRLNAKSLLALWRRLKGLSPRSKLLLLVSPISLYAVVQIGGLFISPSSNVGEGDPSGQRDTLLASSPLVLAGVYPQMPLLEQAQRFQQVLPAYESALADKSEAIATELLMKEAQRLRQTAIAELDFYGEAQDDDFYSLSMVGCAQRVPDVQCILMRFYGDGVRLMAEGEKLGDPHVFYQGYIRTQAATLALAPVNPVEAGEPPTQAWLNYREGLLATLPALPNTAIAGMRLGAEDMKASPVMHLIRQNPLPDTGE